MAKRSRVKGVKKHRTVGHRPKKNKKSPNKASRKGVKSKKKRQKR